MRIVGGELSGRRIDAPTGDATRPTSDRVREAVFNRLAHAFDEDVLSTPVLDLYAGSGGLGLEALSRGAPSCDFVERAPASCAVIRKNLAALKLDARARVHGMVVEAFLKKTTTRHGLVFADPPYADGADLDRVLSLLVSRDRLLPGALIVVEHAPEPAPAEQQPGLALLDRRAYGQTVITFYSFGPA